jgi:hypothetical protein
VPFALQMPERHTVVDVDALHWPSLFAKPHLLSVSQTPLAHTIAPAAAVQVPFCVRRVSRARTRGRRFAEAGRAAEVGAAHAGGVGRGARAVAVRAAAIATCVTLGWRCRGDPCLAIREASLRDDARSFGLHDA